ncbi:MAG: hypothetical protein ACT4OJ_02260 [Bacteroidota bacterium]
MVYIVFGVVVILCIGVVVLAYKVVKENRKLAPKMDEEDDDELLLR